MRNTQRLRNELKRLENEAISLIKASFDSKPVYFPDKFIIHVNTKPYHLDYLTDIIEVSDINSSLPYAFQLEDLELSELIMILEYLDKAHQQIQSDLEKSILDKNIRPIPNN